MGTNGKTLSMDITFVATRKNADRSERELYEMDLVLRALGFKRAFLDELGRGGDNQRYVTDPGSRAALEFGLFGVPETFVIDRSGVIVAKITGGVTYPLLGGVLDAVLAGHRPAAPTPGAVQPAPGASLQGGG